MGSGNWHNNRDFYSGPNTNTNTNNGQTTNMNGLQLLSRSTCTTLQDEGLLVEPDRAENIIRNADSIFI